MISSLQQTYIQKQNDNLYHHEEKVNAICEQVPGLAPLIQQRHLSIMNGIRSGLNGLDKKAVSHTTLPSLLQEYNKKIAALLEAHNFPKNALDPEYACNLCKDEGYLLTPSRHMCSCMKQKLETMMLEEIGLADNIETFENYNANLFSQDYVQQGTTQRQNAQSNKRSCEQYADSFPNTTPLDLLLNGSSGLGKTYLLHAIAHRVIHNGYFPMYTSAFQFFTLARRSHMENNPDLLTSYYEAPLLLLDDLGTEPLLQNITIVQLFALLNERQLTGKHTVISTNLSFAELKERYTERISSRMLDPTRVKRLIFIGQDIRSKLHLLPEEKKS